MIAYDQSPRSSHLHFWNTTGYRLPVGFRIILPKRHPGYRSENTLFREMVSEFVPPSWAKLAIVGGDAAYGSKACAPLWCVSGRFAQRNSTRQRATLPHFGEGIGQRNHAFQNILRFGVCSLPVTYSAKGGRATMAVSFTGAPFPGCHFWEFNDWYTSRVFNAILFHEYTVSERYLA